MPLSAGDKLCPYEILASIAAVGMGELYRAPDPRLNRDVAIKVSGEQFSERFESEAKAIAALNHPNICQIYDVGPDFLVMEYIDGRPIVDCEQPQALPPDEALQLARQIAAALETAHGKGIIHRDLKPANILATSGGVVKLLDFGLAKQNDDSLTDNETQSFGITLVGTIMGTPAYMSPEQAEGKLADARSDIFSFGAVLYEMLAGRRAFSGGSSAATLGAIVHKNPSCWSLYTTAAPLRSTGITPLHCYCWPLRHPLAVHRFPGVAGYTVFCSVVFLRGTRRGS